MTDPELLTKLEKKAKVQIARLETQLADAKADAESWRQQCEKAQDMLFIYILCLIILWNYKNF